MTAEDIAGRVLRSRVHAGLEADLSDLRDLRGKLLQQRMLLVAGDAHLARHAIADLTARLDATEKQICRLRDDLGPHRTEFAERLAGALRPFREAAASRVVELVADLTASLQALEGSTFAMEKVAGAGHVRRLPVPRGLFEIGVSAARIAATGR